MCSEKNPRDRIGAKFNHSLDLTKYPDILYLQLGDFFDNNLVIHNNLIYIEFGSNFNRQLSSCPNNLKYLKFGMEYNKPIILNEGLNYLRF